MTSTPEFEKINIELVRQIQEADWQQLLKKYSLVMVI